MKYLLDTSVLLASMLQHYPRHERAQACYLDATGRGNRLIVAAHSLAELYSVLTTFPVAPKIDPGTAEELIAQNVRARAEVKHLSSADYYAVIASLVRMGVEGGSVYDALIAEVARKANVDRLMTFNVEHFRRVWPDGASRIAAP